MTNRPAVEIDVIGDTRGIELGHECLERFAIIAIPINAAAAVEHDSALLRLDAGVERSAVCPAENDLDRLGVAKTVSEGRSLSRSGGARRAKLRTPAQTCAGMVRMIIDQGKIGSCHSLNRLGRREIVALRRQ